MQTEVGEQRSGAVLECPAADAGRRSHRVQAALTHACERHRFQQLDVEIRALPAGDIRRAAWLNVDPYGTV